jgi:hypothetical protein
LITILAIIFCDVNEEQSFIQPALASEHKWTILRFAETKKLNKRLIESPDQIMELMMP